MNLEKHWLTELVPTIQNHQIADIRNDESGELKAKVIAQVAHALGAEFHQYVGVPKDYSRKENAKFAFNPNRVEESILFLPFSLCDSIGKLEKDIENLFAVRIKYVSEPFQL